MKLMLDKTLVTYPTGDDREVETGTFASAHLHKGLFVTRPNGEVVFVYSEDVIALQNGSYRRQFQTPDDVFTRQTQDAAAAFEAETAGWLA